MQFVFTATDNSKRKIKEKKPRKLRIYTQDHYKSTYSIKFIRHFRIQCK